MERKPNIMLVKPYLFCWCSNNSDSKAPNQSEERLGISYDEDENSYRDKLQISDYIQDPTLYCHQKF